MNANLAVRTTHAMCDALERRDIDGFRAVFTADAKIWRNYQMFDLPMAQLVEEFRQVLGAIESLRYTQRRIVPVEGGALNQNVVEIRCKDGSLIRMPQLNWMFVDDEGKISRIEEYVDSAMAARIAAAMGAVLQDAPG